MLKKLAEFVQEGDGSNSSMRLMMLVATVSVVSVWGFVAIWKLLHMPELTAYEVPDIPWNVVTMVLGIVGIKAYQKGKEESTTALEEHTEKTETTTLSREPATAPKPA